MKRTPTSEDISGDGYAYEPQGSMADQGLLPAQDPKYAELAAKLQRCYGGGENPSMRRKLFDRLQRESIQYGDVVYRVVVGASRSAACARDPARYFCAVVSRRLREQGFLRADDSVPFERGGGA